MAVISPGTEREIQSQIVHALQVGLVFGVGLLVGLAPGEAFYACVATWTVREGGHIRALQNEEVRTPDRTGLERRGIWRAIKHEATDLIVGYGTAVALLLTSGAVAIF